MAKYTGGCHCGKVRYQVDMDLTGLIACNCSICSKKGLILGFVKEAQFSLVSGQNELSDYQFNKKHIHHLFCKNCGVSSFCNGADQDGSNMYAINVRCLDGVDLATLVPTPIDGKSR
ncbi:MAG TPA: GFA family protein [Oligoflexus sp.]|uniref:GFA family protein n=1 Tax=Oligoflexus sp. TaxID=1971216 RepID=UPI002D2E080E|nr:GFA family protein [Oligoflexus sp.]HYX38384.1 GFA family protein [Oligoflexus sp.]